MRIVGLTWCVLAAVSTPAGGQPQAATPVVTIEVTVLTQDGRPVPGLTTADFEIKLDGRVEPIRDLAYLQVSEKMAGAVGPTFDAVTPAVSSVYRLVIHAPSSTAPGREFAVGARVLKPGVSVLANGRAVAALPGSAPAPATAAKPSVANAVSIDEQLKAAIATGRALQGVPIAIGRALRRAPDPRQVSIDVDVEIPSSAKGPVTAVFGVVDAAGAIRNGRKEVEAAPDGSPYRLSFSLSVAPGTYKLRLAVADAAGAVGARESIVDARLAAMGPFTASDLLRFTAGAGGQPRSLTAQDLPGSATALTAALELYPVAGAVVPADVLVKIDLLTAGDQTPVIERVVTPEPRDGMLVAEAEFPLGRLTTGAYSLRATVLSGAVVLGTTSATFAKR
jgi:hypothetical protein